MVGADEIIVVDRGVIVERGSHPDLLARGGVYAALWNRQREADEARERLKRAEDEDDESLRRAIEPGDLPPPAGAFKEPEPASVS